jgi:hypothetical protein
LAFPCNRPTPTTEGLIDQLLLLPKPRKTDDPDARRLPAQSDQLRFIL